LLVGAGWNDEQVRHKHEHGLCGVALGVAMARTGRDGVGAADISMVGVLDCVSNNAIWGDNRPCSQEVASDIICGSLLVGQGICRVAPGANGRA